MIFCKSYLCFLVETTWRSSTYSVIATRLFIQSYFKTIWKQSDEFFKVIPLMSGFHAVLCLKKAIYKRYACLRLKKWITGVGITKSSLAAEKTVHGLHYNTLIRVYKEIFDAIVQI